MSAPRRFWSNEHGCFVTICPPGRALGADDLENWSKRRGRGWSGSDSRRERKRAEAFAEGKLVRRHHRAKRTD